MESSRLAGPSQPLRGLQAVACPPPPPGDQGARTAAPSRVGNAPLINSQSPLSLLDRPPVTVGTVAEYAAWFGDESHAVLGVGVMPITQVTNIDNETLQTLKGADRALRHTKELLPWGAANQVVDVWRTNANSVLARRERLLAKDGLSVDAIIRSGVGNCGEHARVAQSVILTEATTRPVMRVRAAEGDHNFVVLGDPRELPADKLVVADAWVTFPTAHLLNEGRWGIGAIIEQSTPQVRGSPLLSTPEIGTPRNSLSDKAEAMRHIATVANEGRGMFEDHVSVLALDHAYHDGTGEPVRFDTYPRAWIEKRINTLGEYSLWQEGARARDDG